MTTIAERMKEIWDRIPYDYENNAIDEKGLSRFRETLKINRKEVKEDCPQSYDSSLTYTFKDGSKARLGNPHQSAFTAFFYVIDENTKCYF